VKAPNGRTQVTYNHWPLYRFIGDSKDGQAHGQGLTAFGGKWFAITPAGKRAKKITPPTATVHAATVAGVGTVLVNSAGRTLYLFNPDRQKMVTCTGACAQAWPPLDVTSKPIAGKGIKASLLGTVKAPNGTTQVTYNHWPLYRFIDDSTAGQANGEELTAFGGEWFAVTPAGTRAMISTSSTSTTTSPPPGY
jgi:predicted lipoprotein with Yx(FWY)xxD motif